jgi:hypothetical protein
MMSPFLIKWIIDFIKDPKAETMDGAILVGLLIGSQLVSYVINEHVEFWQCLVGVRSTNVLIAIIYEKLLKISSATNKKFNQGEVINFVQVDAERLQWMTQVLP